MGLAGGEAAAASLAAWEDDAWRRGLPPVWVVTRDTPSRLTLHLPARDTRRAWQWHLRLETGGVLAGTFIPEQLDLLDSRELAGAAWQARALDLPGIAQTGYHHLEVRSEASDAGIDLPMIVTPERCHQPESIQRQRVWGLSVQLYGVRSRRNWGMGDFTDLGRLLEWAAGAGASLVGINPLHALFPHEPRHASPYSPSSRRFLNVLYLDVEAVPEFAACDEARQWVAAAGFQARLRALRDADRVDYAGVAAAKFAVLARLHRYFRAQRQDGERARAFAAWREQGGETLRRFAVHHALQAHFHARDSGLWGWQTWPPAYRDPDSEAVAAFVAEHAEAVEYVLYLQWLAEAQLDAVLQRARSLGMGIGLYRDLAVGVDAGGAETWSRREWFALAARVGSPPDDFNLFGQDWGLPPWVPHRLREAAYAPFIAMLRANMRGGGALRLDHVMGLLRLFWLPPGMRGDQGAYVAYPFRDLLGILALESQRNRCLVVGEDLGTVPDAVRVAMREMGMLSYRLFYFEREADAAFLAPARYPEAAMVAASIHDLPTLAGFWQGVDLDLRARLGLFPDEAERGRQVDARAADRQRLLDALVREGVLPDALPTRAEAIPELTPELALAIHRLVARAPSRVALAQAEDMLGEVAQVNLPGTTDAYPNWQAKLTLDLEDWPNDPRVGALARAMNDERGPVGAS